MLIETEGVRKVCKFLINILVITEVLHFMKKLYIVLSHIVLSDRPSTKWVLQLYFIFYSYLLIAYQQLQFQEWKGMIKSLFILPAKVNAMGILMFATVPQKRMLNNLCAKTMPKHAGINACQNNIKLHYHKSHYN